MKRLVDEQTPEERIALARDGDDETRGALLETYRSYLELLARLEIGQALRTKLDTSDLVQETFLEAFAGFNKFHGTGEPELVGWLRSILTAKTNNLVRHYLGTQGRDIRREQRLEINLDYSSRLLDRGLMAPESTPSRQAAQRELGVLLAEALAALPDDYREVVVLRNLEELSFPEVASRMNRSVDSIQKIWVRALVRLRQAMKDAE